MAEILVIDDEPDLVRFVCRALEADGHRVTSAWDGADGLSMAMQEPPDLVVLDLLMPGVDGRSVLAALQASRPEVRVLVLSADADVGARVEVLEAGAVDFLAKPFAVRELVARVRSRLSNPAQPLSNGHEFLRVGAVTLDIQARTIHMDDRAVTLSQREFLLLRHLMRRADRVCSREELLSEVWGYAFDPATNVVDVCVARLRHKLRGDLIRTVRNVGYRLASG
ncbi:response regulator transcription factor [Nocardioides sp.]|jgi:DNA-binding response OmpR family regulator|uniref:response regulator transcription factor n=1 Tax=Nocardioides sp. TaxID=35761 RepID=UPI0031FE586D|nr:putative OmpR family two-component response regulator [Nocardioides sp.]